MADGGWIKLYRKIRKSFVWTSSDQLKLWLLILMKANHEPNKFLFNGQEVTVTSGQMVTGAHAIASEFNEGVPSDKAIAWRTLWRWVKKFENEQMLTISSNARYSVITVLNWDTYQSNDKPLTSSGQSSDNLLTTNKNDKNEEKDKKRDISSLLLDDENKIQEIWENNGFGFLAPKTRQDFEYWIDDFEKIGATRNDASNLIVKAINIAIDSNSKRYSYINGILQNWESLKITTVKMADADAKQHASKSKSKQKQKKPFQNFEQNDDQYDDLPF